MSYLLVAILDFTLWQLPFTIKAIPPVAWYHLIAPFSITLVKVLLAAVTLWVIGIVPTIAIFHATPN
jgi:hypothetical protein